MAINQMLVFHSIQIFQVCFQKKIKILSLISFLLVNTQPHPSFDMYNNNNNNSRFADSGYLSRTPTPPTPVRMPSPQPLPIKHELDINGIYLSEYIYLHYFLHFVQRWIQEIRIIH